MVNPELNLLVNLHALKAINEFKEKKIGIRKSKRKRQTLKIMFTLHWCEWASSDSLHRYGKVIQMCAIANASEIHSSLSQCERTLKVHLYKGPFALDDKDVFFRSSYANGYIDDNATHL